VSRPRDSEDGLRDVFVTSRMTQKEVDRLDKNRGNESRSQYLRRLAAEDKRRN
jgi:hypothetical protein